MKNSIDINCDLGEGLETDEAIMPYISSANIACGYHAGNEAIMAHTISLCKKYNVFIGAHPSFDDKQNFGRIEMRIGEDELYDLVYKQLDLLAAPAYEQGMTLHHVKPHGALYNMAARDERIAITVVRAVKDFNPSLIVYGLSSSFLIYAAQAHGLLAYQEVFADRRYQPDGSLASRILPNAVIEDVDELKNHINHLLVNNSIIALNGDLIPIKADTICIHGDGKHAVQFAQVVYEELNKASIHITKPG